MKETHPLRDVNPVAAAKASTLSDALPYMRQYAGRTVVIKFGGHAMGEESLTEAFARDIVLMKQVGMNPVVVHGGGPQIGAMLERLKIKSEYIDGLRVTDAATVEIVEMVLCGSINKSIVSAINRAGGHAVGLSGKDGQLIEARKLRHRPTQKTDSNIERLLDLGFVGEPTFVNPHVLDVLAESDIIPVIAPIGMDPNGQTYNINADTAAAALAEALGAEKLLMLTDVEGLYTRWPDRNSLVSEIDTATLTDLLPALEEGMVPKIEACLRAVDAGVPSAHVIDGRVEHCVLVELFTDAGTGTKVVRA